jgi:tRNA (guanine26-N2/guanine27-N2)-dimethyltransferase
MKTIDGQHEHEAFYNPVQRFNRDLSLLVTLAYCIRSKSEHPDKEITYCDAFTATGLRMIRSRLELPRTLLDHIVACDLSADAIHMARQNLKLNGLGIPTLLDETSDSLTLKQKDCTIEFSERSQDGRQRVCIADLDPFGSSLPYLRAAISGTRGGGLVAATFTDLRVVEGPDHGKLFSLYGALRGPHADHKEEASLRLVLAAVHAEAHKLGKAVRPLLAVWKHFYMRVGSRH